MVMSNAEKQARFRQKEQLKKHVSQISRECQFLAGTKLHLKRTFGDLDSQLREAAELPSGWTDADLELAYNRVQNLYGDVVGAVDFLSADVEDARDSLDPFLESSNPRRWKEDQTRAERETIALAGLLVSALDVSQLPNEQRAAALIEAVRHAGRSLGNSVNIGEADATAVCLAALNRHYERPEWFVERLAGWLERNLDANTVKALGERLLQEVGGPSR